MLSAVVLTLVALTGHINGFDFNDQGGPQAAKGMRTRCKAGFYEPGNIDNTGAYVRPQTQASPFKVDIVGRSRSYDFDQVVTVKITGNRAFKEFFCFVDGQEMTMGPPMLSPAGDFTGKRGESKTTMYCGMPGVTHVNSNPKTQATFSWKLQTPQPMPVNPFVAMMAQQQGRPPPKPETPEKAHLGKVTFKCTIVENNQMYWTGVESIHLQPPKAKPGQQPIKSQEQLAEEKMKQAQQMMQRMQQRMPGGQGGSGGFDIGSMMKGMGLPGLPGGAAPGGGPGGMPGMPMPMPGMPMPGQSGPPQPPPGMGNMGAMMERFQQRMQQQG